MSVSESNCHNHLLEMFESYIYFKIHIEQYKNVKQHILSKEEKEKVREIETNTEKIWRKEWSCTTNLDSINIKVGNIIYHYRKYKLKEIKFTPLI